MNTIQQPSRTFVVGSIVAGLAVFTATLACAQQTQVIPVTVGSPDIQNSVVVFSSTDPQFKITSLVAIANIPLIGDDLHLLRGGLLTSFQFSLSADQELDVSLNFYVNDADDEGVVPGDLMVLDDLIASIPVGTVPAAVGLLEETRYVFDVEVDPPVMLPPDVWAVIDINDPGGGSLTVAYPGDPEIGASHAPIWFGQEGGAPGFIDDAGSISLHFVLRMAPDPSTDTPEGTNVVLSPEPGLTLTFNNVTQQGATTVTTSGTNPEPDSNFEFLGVFYDIESNAQFNGQVEVCFDYDDSGLTVAQENALQLLHFKNGSWNDITDSIDTDNNVLCGLTNSFSPFAIGHRLPNPAQAMLEDLIDQVSILNLNQGISNSLDGKLDQAIRALDDLNESNDTAATLALLAFLNEVEAQRGSHISEEDAIVLIDLALEALAAM